MATQSAGVLMITAIQKKTAQAIVNIFETSSVLGDYGSVTVIPGDTGHLTFGRSQTTLGSGNLFLLLQEYCGNAGAKFAAGLQGFLPRFASKDLTLDTEDHLHNILRATADDALMRETQDEFFDVKYWQVAERAAQRIGITTPLGIAVVYDSTVHGSLDMIRKRTTDAVGDPATCGEQAWSTSPRKDLQATVYRMDAFQRLIDQSQWGLQLPLVVRSLEISSLTLNATPSGCYDGPTPGTRAIALQAPLLRGLDVRLVQLGLSAQGMDVKADGVFGRTSVDFVKQYQASKSLPATGVVDTSLIATLIA
jgi:chitosanase